MFRTVYQVVERDKAEHRTELKNYSIVLLRSNNQYNAGQMDLIWIYIYEIQ